MLNTLMQIIPAVVSGAVIILAAIAPLTKSNLDNSILDVLRFIEDKLLSVLFPSLKNPPETK